MKHDIDATSRARRGWLRRGWRAFAGVGCALISRPLIASGTPFSRPGDEDRQRFAAAIEVEVENLRGLQRLPIPVGVALAGLWVGIVDSGGDPQPWLLGVPHGKAPPSPLRLPFASEVDLLAQLDLSGRALKIDLLPPASGAASAALVSPQRARRPALLLRATHRLGSGEQRDTLLLVQLAPSLVLVWREVATLIRPRGDGFRSFALELVRDPDSAWLALDLYQTTLPASDQPAAAPGPPLRLHFGHRDGAYRRL